MSTLIRYPLQFLQKITLILLTVHSGEPVRAAVAKPECNAYQSADFELVGLSPNDLVL